MNRVLKAILATLFVATATFSPVVAIAKDRQSERHITEISSGQTVPLIIRNSSEGGTDSGGGDPKFMWKQTLQLSSDAVFSEEVLAHAIMIFLSDMNSISQRISGILLVLKPEMIEDQNVRKLFIDLKKRGLIEDVGRSEVKPQNRCVLIEDGMPVVKNGLPVERAATAIMNSPVTPICVDPVKMAKSMEGVARGSILFGLMVHEYIHHFGIRDEDHRIAIEFTKALENTIAAERASNVSYGDLLQEIAKNLKPHWDENLPWIQALRKCIGNRNCF